MIKIAKDKPLHVLSIGTKILIKDVMDTYMRSLGEVKTYYAYKMSTAIETFQEKKPNIIFCEQNFPEGGALEFIQYIGGLPASGDHYFVLASESSSEDLVSLAMEKGMDEILVKPFATDNIHQIVERYLEKKAQGATDWVADLRAARKSFQEKRFQEAEELMAAAARKYAQNPSVLQEVADFFLLRNNPQIAHPMLDAILKDSPENVRALSSMGSTLKRMGRLREASEKFLKANSLSPLNSLRNAELAETFLFLAEEQIQTALKNENENSNFILAKARYQLVRKDYSAMVIYLDAKRAFLSESAKKEADTIVAIAKKLGGIK